MIAIAPDANRHKVMQPVASRGALRASLRRGKFVLWRMRLSLKAMLPGNDFQGCGERPVLISPRKIRFDATRVLATPRRAGIVAGDWDRQAKAWPLGGGERAESPRRDVVPGSGDWPEVPLAVGRDGVLFAVDHAPLIVLAQKAQVEQMQVRVVARHPGWLRICREFQCFARKLPGRQPYQPCTHIDLADQPSSWSERRFHIIRDCLSAPGGRFLDIGANLGYFCHCAEELGYDCLAVESCPRLAYFLERLRRAESRRFDVFCGSVLEYPFHEPFDVVLALNVFHHFLKSESSHRRLIEMLGRMRMREMIFQSHKPGERQMASAFRDYSPEEFVGFLLDHSCLASAEYIGADRERPIYRLRAA